MSRERKDLQIRHGPAQFQAHRAYRTLTGGPVRSTLCFAHFLKNLSIQGAYSYLLSILLPDSTLVSRSTAHIQSLTVCWNRYSRLRNNKRLISNVNLPFMHIIQHFFCLRQHAVTHVLPDFIVTEMTEEADTNYDVLFQRQPFLR